MEKWEKTRKKGPLRFIFIYGILMIGVSGIVVSILFPGNERTGSQNIVTTALFYIGFGGFVGTCTWFGIERLFQNDIKTIDDEDILVEMNQEMDAIKNDSSLSAEKKLELCEAIHEQFENRLKQKNK